MKNKNIETPSTENTFYFSKGNFRLMLIGLGLIALGFVLMMGYGANTKPDGSFDPNYFFCGENQNSAFAGGCWFCSTGGGYTKKK